jgi:hypothetical protein
VLQQIYIYIYNKKCIKTFGLYYFRTYLIFFFIGVSMIITLPFIDVSKYLNWRKRTYVKLFQKKMCRIKTKFDITRVFLTWIHFLKNVLLKLRFKNQNTYDSFDSERNNPQIECLLHKNHLYEDLSSSMISSEVIRS